MMVVGVANESHPDGICSPATLTRIFQLTQEIRGIDGVLPNEARFRLDPAHYGVGADTPFMGDFLTDGVLDDVAIDARQVLLVLHAARRLDIRARRQVLTWGTGDLLSLNDPFPKDWQSFFIGRDDEYLKAPSNSVELAAYSAVNLDLAWTPAIAPDGYITGERRRLFQPVHSQRI
jgi:hypothetical protein